MIYYIEKTMNFTHKGAYRASVSNERVLLHGGRRKWLPNPVGLSDILVVEALFYFKKGNIEPSIPEPATIC
jgi:hypothetical protein